MLRRKKNFFPILFVFSHLQTIEFCSEQKLHQIAHSVSFKYYIFASCRLRNEKKNSRRLIVILCSDFIKIIQAFVTRIFYFSNTMKHRHLKVYHFKYNLKIRSLMYHFALTILNSCRRYSTA